MSALLIALVLAAPSFAASECIGYPTDVSEPFKGSDLIFTGTLVRDEYQDRLTFRADRIWKGSPKQSNIVVYVPHGAFFGAYAFRVGDRYLLFAHVLSKDEAKFIYEDGCEQLILGSGQMGNVHLSPEAETYFAKKRCTVLLQPTPKAIHTFNDSHAKKIGFSTLPARSGRPLA